jgi:hypothetical protein
MNPGVWIHTNMLINSCPRRCEAIPYQGGVQMAGYRTFDVPPITIICQVSHGPSKVTLALQLLVVIE